MLQIPPTNGTPYVLQNVDTSHNETRYYWTIQAHSHSRGTDYDMFKRNSDGSKGEQIYEGFYNEDYSQNQGFYNYTHPAVRRFNPLLPIDMNDGLIYEGTWVNNTDSIIPFGFTTKEEMFITYYQYTNEIPSAIEETEGKVSGFSVYPNPGKDLFNMVYTSKNSSNATVELFDYTGTKVKTVFNGMQSAGKQTMQLDLSKDNLAAGIYFVTLSTDGAVSSKKLIRID